MIGKQFNKDSIALIYITVLTGIALVYGFSIVPSPAREQALSFDHKRVIDLGILQYTIDSYYRDHSKLPNSLADLPTTSTYSSSPLNKKDPQTKQPYEYKITSPFTYKLCATFTTNSSKDEPTYDLNNTSYYSNTSTFTHPAKYTCFTEKETNYPASYSNTVTPSPLTNGPASPSATVVLFKDDTCHWTATFSLKGFSPASTITTHSHGTVFDNCNASKSHTYGWTGTGNQQTSENGSSTISYPHIDYGDYNYTFVDSEGHTTSIHFTYDQQSTQPTILPTKTPEQ